MRTKIFICLLGFLIVNAIYSCRKDAVEITEDITLAKKGAPENVVNYFNNMRPGGININGFKHPYSTNAKNSSFSFFLDPIWGLAETFQKGDSVIVEVPLSGVMPLFSQSEKTTDEASETKLLFIKTKVKTRAVLMTVMAEAKYLKGNVDKVKKNSFKKKEKDFSGKVLYHTLSGLFLNGFRYDEGFVTMRISASSAPYQSKKANSPSIKAEQLVCESVPIWQTVQYAGKTYWSVLDWYDQCHMEGTSTTGGGSGSGGTSGGGGGSSTTPPPTNDPGPDDPCGSTSTYLGVTPTISQAIPCEDGEEPQVIPFSIFTIGIHRDITRKAAEKEGFCPSAVNWLMAGVAATDYVTVGGMVPNTSPFHFDGLSGFGAVANNWDQLSSILNGAISANNYFAVGMLTHAFQDFYSHSNYAELLIKYYGNDMQNVSFSDLLNDTAGQYNGFKQYLVANLHTGSFDLLSQWYPSAYEGLGFDYTQTHGYISKDDASTYAGKYALRLAERESRKIVARVANKCN